MVELNQSEFVAQSRGQHFAFELPTLQTFFDQRSSAHEQTPLGVDQGVVDVCLHIERLVGRNGPRGGGPNHGESWLVKLRQAKGSSQFFGLGAQEGHIQGIALFVGVFDFELRQG